MEQEGAIGQESSIGSRGGRDTRGGVVRCSPAPYAMTHDASPLPSLILLTAQARPQPGATAPAAAAMGKKSRSAPGRRPILQLSPPGPRRDEAAAVPPVEGADSASEPGIRARRGGGALLAGRGLAQASARPTRSAAA